MASDSFTDSNGTGLESHDANWAEAASGYPVTTLEINSNIVEHESTWQDSSAAYTASSEEDSQIVFVGGSSLAVRHVACRMDTGTGDADDDGYIDVDDFAVLASCMTGPDIWVEAGCEVMDVNGDCDADLADLAAWQPSFTGNGP